MTMRFLGVAMVCVGLGGCFTSPKALIEPVQAEFPVAAPVEIGDVLADGTSRPLQLVQAEFASRQVHVHEGAGRVLC